MTTASSQTFAKPSPSTIISLIVKAKPPSFVTVNISTIASFNGTSPKSISSRDTLINGTTPFPNSVIAKPSSNSGSLERIFNSPEYSIASAGRKVTLTVKNSPCGITSSCPSEKSVVNAPIFEVMELTTRSEYPSLPIWNCQTLSVLTKTSVKSWELASTVISAGGSKPTPTNGTCTSAALSALDVIVSKPLYSMPDSGENVTSTSTEPPGSMTFSSFQSMENTSPSIARFSMVKSAVPTFRRLTVSTESSRTLTTPKWTS